MIYIYNIWRLYLLIQSLHGVYVTYTFIKFIATNTYYGGAWVLSFFYNPYDVAQIEDKKYITKEENNYLIIE
jgi:hypothetical protein